MKSHHHVRGSKWKSIGGRGRGRCFSQIQEGDPESGRDGEEESAHHRKLEHLSVRGRSSVTVEG